MTRLFKIKELIKRLLGWCYRNLLPKFHLKDQEVDFVHFTSSGVPKIIHRTWKTRSFDLAHYKDLAGIQRRNPEWQFRLSLDEDMNSFMKNKYGDLEIGEIFFKTKIASSRADIWRLAVIYEQGGGYLDIDSMIHVPLDGLIGDKSQLFSLESNRLFDFVIPDSPMSQYFIENTDLIRQKGWNPNSIVLNWCFFSHPKNKLFQIAMDTIVENFSYFQNRKFKNVHQAIVNFTGPILLTQAIWKLILRGGEFSTESVDFDGHATFKKVPKFGLYSDALHSTQIVGVKIVTN